MCAGYLHAQGSTVVAINMNLPTHILSSSRKKIRDGAAKFQTKVILYAQWTFLRYEESQDLILCLLVLNILGELNLMQTYSMDLVFEQGLF